MLSSHSAIYQLSPAEKEALLSLVDRIIENGGLGKSKVHVKLLRYLVDCTIQDSTPKEMTIAIDVLGRSVDFDISRDSIVRVQMYQLREKLDRYFQGPGRHEKFHLVIPKGQYGLAIVPGAGSDTAQGATPNPAGDVAADRKSGGSLALRRGWTYALAALMAVCIVALSLNLYVLLHASSKAVPAAIVPAAVVLDEDLLAGYGFWKNVIDDDMKVLVLVGDYYIFGERALNGGLVRMVRDFDINSAADFETRAIADPGLRTKYLNLNMSYIPTGVADALAELMPLLSSHSKQVQVKMLSELNTSDLVSNHIVYLGLLSGLSQLHDLMFAASGLYIGSTYDELHTVVTDEYYSSSSSIAGPGGSFRDYGILSAFTAPRGNQFVMLTGMRDAGLINVVEQAVSPANLAVLAEAIGSDPATMTAFEALYEVSGLQDTNFDTRLVHRQLLDSAIIWETRLVNTPPHH